MAMKSNFGQAESRGSTVGGVSVERRIAGYWAVAVHFKAGFRLGLGLAQMFMAVFSAVLLLETGLNRWSVSSAVFTTLLTLTSRRLFQTKASK
jgi:hypothetical protein